MNVANLKSVVCCIMSILVVTAPETVSAQVIYGLDKARHFNVTQPGPYFVQVGAFVSKDLAYKLKTKLTASTDYPISIHIVGKYYSVVIGPMPSINAVHAIGGVRAAEVVRRAPEVATQTPTYRRQISNVKKPSPLKQIPSVSSINVENNWFVAANVGAMRTSTKNRMTVQNDSGFPPPSDVDQYSVTTQPKPVVLDFRAGRRWQRDEQWLPAYALALRYQHLFTSNVKGNVTQYSLPEFDNYYYHWGVGADIVSLYSKINLTQYGRVMPYVDAGLGVSLNHSLSYREKAFTGVTPRISPAFGSGTSTELSYNVGAGVDIVLTPKLLASIGYDYQQFGNMSSGNGQSTWSREHLSLGTPTSNMALLGITYLIDDSFIYH